jgi:hypothetical protein
MRSRPRGRDMQALADTNENKTCVRLMFRSRYS